MSLFENFPYTNLHQLNLDWLVAEMKKVEDTIKYGPVVSVNGLTGEVVLYQEANVRLPDVMNPTQTNWNIFRYLNGHVYGIEFDATGNVYQIQDQYRRKLLTWADIPPESGVISINGKYGVVRLYGSDIQTSGDDPKTVMESIYDLDELTSTLQTISNAVKNSLAYVENTNTATHNMSSGTYVLWNNGAYKVKSGTNIAIGDTLSSSNLDAIGTKGFINDLNDSISALNNKITTSTEPSYSAEGCRFVKTLNTITAYIAKEITAEWPGWYNINDDNHQIAVTDVPKYQFYFTAYNNTASASKDALLKARVSPSTNRVSVYFDAGGTYNVYGSVTWVIGG